MTSQRFPIRKRKRKDGSVGYNARPRGPDGETLSKTFDRWQDAKDFCTAVWDEQRRGIHLDRRRGTTPLATVAEDWWATLTEHKPSSRAGYRSLLDAHVLPAFGRTEVRAISRWAIKRWLAGMRAAGLGPGVRRNAFSVLRLVLGAAADDNMIPANPAAGLRLDPVDPVERHARTAAEARKLADAIEAVRPGLGFGVLILTATYTGMRWSELAGLRVGRLHLDTGQAEVAEAILSVNGKFCSGTPKNNKTRVVRLPRQLCEALSTHIAERQFGPADLVWTMPRGGPLRYSNFRTHYFLPAVKAAGLESVTGFHELRHTHASLMKSAGINDKVRQAQMGHSTQRMTDHYTHPYEEDMAALAERLEEIWT